jgi:4-amino-4-deoxychorismate lyase
MQTGRAYQIHALGDRADRGLMYAEACFETFRVIAGSIFRWPEHAGRMQRGADAFGLDFAADETLIEACLGAASEAGDDALVRITLTGGEAPWGLTVRAAQPCVHIQAMPYAGAAGDAVLRAVDWPFPPRLREAKFTGDYAEGLRALAGWRRDGLLLSEEEPLICAGEHILGALGANVLLYREGAWLTPEHGPGVLPGTVRQALLEAGAIRACPCPAIWLADCEAIALVNAGSFIRPAAAIDGRALATESERSAPLWQVLRGESGVPA